MQSQDGACRICNQPETNTSALVFIHSPTDDGTPVVTMIEKLADVKIPESDCFSRKVCVECLRNIQIGYAIRTTIRESEKTKLEGKFTLSAKERINRNVPSHDHTSEQEIKLEHEWVEDDDFEYEYLEEEYLDGNGKSMKNVTSGMDSQNVERTHKKTHFIMPKAEVILRTIDRGDHLLVEVKGDRCCGCSFVGVNRRDLLQHSASEHSIEIVGSGNYCPICFFKFASENALTRHIDECKSKSIYVCKKCEMHFNTLRKIESHLRNCKGSSATTETDSLVAMDTSESDVMVLQVEKIDEDENSVSKYEESEIDSDWQNVVEELEAEELIMELDMDRQGGQKRDRNGDVLEPDWNCCDGEKSCFIQESQIVQRITFKTFQYVKLKGERCCGCEFICQKREQLFQHAKEKHEQDVNNHSDGFICPICYLNFADNKQLLKHINFNTSRDLLICSLCDEAFTGKSSLRYHQECSEKHQQNFQQLFGSREADEKLLVELNDDDVVKAFEYESLDGNIKDKSRMRSNNRSITRHRHLTMPDKQFITHVDEFKNYEVITVNGERCCGCGQFFETYNELLQHGRRTHLIENAESIGEYQCGVCFARFEWDRGLLMHRSMRRTVNKFYHCKICDLMFSKKYSMAKHLQNAPNHLASMIDKAIENAVPADQLEKDENIAEALELHTRSRPTLNVAATTNTKFHCCLPKCGQEFTNEDLLLNHCKDVHSGKRRENDVERSNDTNVCPGCCKAFENTSCLVWHRFTRFTKQYPCRFCGQVFARWPAYREHENVVHLGKSNEFPCEICNKVFRTAPRLKAHKETHEEERKQVCDECGARFRNRGVLKRHRRSVHANDYPFDCNVCTKKFATQEQLNAHTRVHTGVKPYPCRFCERAFSHFTDRKRHEMSTHTGERPHQCPHCPAAYIRNRELVIHMQKHTEESAA